MYVIRQLQSGQYIITSRYNSRPLLYPQPVYATLSEAKKALEENYTTSKLYKDIERVWPRLDSME